MATVTAPTPRYDRVQRLGGGAAEIRKFGDAQINAWIDKALLQVPEDKTGMVVAHATQDGAALSVVGRIGDGWTVVAAAYKPFHGPLELEAAVRYTW